MKWTVAIVAVVVGAIGLCGAAELSTDQKPAVTTPRPAPTPLPTTATTRARNLIAETLRAQAVPRAPLSQPESAPALMPWPIRDAEIDRVPLDMALAFASAEGSRCFARDGGTPEQKVDNCTALIQSAGHTSQVLASAYLNRGFAYDNKGDYDRAIADYGEAIRLHPQFALAYSNRGIVYNRKGNYDRAFADFGEAIRLNPKLPNAYAGRGWAYHGKGDFDRAFADFDEAIRLDPKFPKTYNPRGLAYHSIGELDRAIVDFDEAVRLDPKYAEAYGNRGLVYASKRDYARAIADYDQALTLDPSLVDARQNRQLAQTAIATQAVQTADRADDARPDFDDTNRTLRAADNHSETISVNPQNAVEFRNRGLAYLRKGRFDPAIEDFSEAILLNPLYTSAYFSRGVAYKQKGEHDRAIADFNEVIRLDPNNAGAYNNRGWAYNGKGSYDRAIADLDVAIRLNPKLPNAYNNRGRAYNSKGNYDRAIANLDEAIRLDPNFRAAYGNRGIAYNSKSEYDRAIADLNEVMRLDPNEALAYNARGFAYAGKRDYAHAIADYDQALTLDPSLFDARQNRERAQAAMATQMAPAPTPTGPERRVALVIGNSEYRSAPFLSNPRRDAKAVADALRQIGFQSVELAIDLDRDAMVKALHTFRDQADKADWALIYFAGHGIEINRINYLIPTDAKLHDDRDVQTEAVSYEELLNTIGRAKALRLVILDACRVNPFKERMNRTMANPPPQPLPPARATARLAAALIADWLRRPNRRLGR
jgi:tetratricopeptide (TPR) repeat protein